MNTTKAPPLLAARAIRCLAQNWQHDVDNHTAGAGKITREEAEWMQLAAIRGHCHPEAQDAVAFLIPQIREHLQTIDEIGLGLVCDCAFGCRHEAELERAIDELIGRLVTGRLHTERSLRVVGS